jgi:aspartate aminotransferase-like enzyme
MELLQARQRAGIVVQEPHSMAINFRYPGPTPLPPRVREALGHEMEPHRGPAFRALLTELFEMARAAHRTEHEVLVWAGSGSAGWEIAIVNLFSPGDPVLAAINGNFGERFAGVAKRLGLDVRRLDVEWGQPILPDQLRDALKANPDVKGVLLVHNETSTGVTNSMKELAGVVRDHGALVLVDSVSGIGALPLEMDDWGIDLVMSGSQKAWMCPPGLAIVAAGPRAWAATETSTYPRFFWDMRESREWAKKGMTPTTSPMTLLYGYHAALQLIHEEGIENVWQRHRELGEFTRQAVRNAGLDLFAAPGYESNSVTAFRPPAGVPASEMLKILQDEYGVVAQSGQAHMVEEIVRIGHMGWAHMPEMEEAMAAVAATATQLRAKMPETAPV